jgi:hypothetical protein
LLKQAAKALGKSLLIVTGVSYGMIKALDLLAEQSQQDSSGVDPASPTPGDVPVTPMNTPSQTIPMTAARTTPQDNRNTVISDHTAADDRSSVTPSFSQEATLRRLHGMEEMLIRMEKGIEILISPFEQKSMRGTGRGGEDFITRAEQSAALEELAIRLEADIERRFEVQNRSVQSLRTMIARTDELLERVIESIESTSFTG